MRRWGLLVVTGAGVVGMAAAKPPKPPVAAVVPAELDGIVTQPPNEGWWQTDDRTRTAIGKVDHHTLAGVDLLVWTEHWTQHTKDPEGDAHVYDDVTVLVVADPQSKAVLLAEPLERKYDAKVYESGLNEKASYKYDWAWTDVDGDGEAELVLGKKADSKKKRPAERLFQVRFGELREVPREMAACAHDGVVLSREAVPAAAPAAPAAAAAPAAVDPHAAAAEAVAAKALDAADASGLRCALFGMALLSPDADLPLPGADSPVVFSAPVAPPAANAKAAPAAPPAPAPAPADKHATRAGGRKPPPPPPPPPAPRATRQAFYADANHFPHWVTMSPDAHVVVAPFDPQMDPLQDDKQTLWPNAWHYLHFDAVAIDGAVFLVLVIDAYSVEDFDPAEKFVRSDVFIYNAVTGEQLATEPLSQGKKKNVRQAVFKDTDGDGVPELTVAAGKSKKGAAVYAYDKTKQAWAKR